LYFDISQSSPSNPLQCLGLPSGIRPYGEVVIVNDILKTKETPIPYRSVAGRELSLHIPHWPDKPAVALVFVHGGGWTGGEPAVLFELARLLAAEGVLMCLPQYRLLGEAEMTFDEQISDVQLAWQTAYATIREHFGETLPIAFGGGSAGGHLSLMAFHRANSAAMPLPQPAAWVLGNPVIDTSAEGYGNQICGAQWRELSPRHAIREALGQILFLQGTDDALTSAELAQAFVNDQRGLGSTVDMHMVPGAQHGYFNAPEHRQTTAKAIVEFLINLL
jgi:acetyl esterase/lipase